MKTVSVTLTFLVMAFCLGGIDFVFAVTKKEGIAMNKNEIRIDLYYLLILILATISLCVLKIMLEPNIIGPLTGYLCGVTSAFMMYLIGLLIKARVVQRD